MHKHIRIIHKFNSIHSILIILLLIHSINYGSEFMFEYILFNFNFFILFLYFYHFHIRYCFTLINMSIILLGLLL